MRRRHVHAGLLRDWTAVTCGCYGCMPVRQCPRRLSTARCVAKTLMSSTARQVREMLAGRRFTSHSEATLHTTYLCVDDSFTADPGLAGLRSVFGRPFVKRFALCYRTVVCPVCLSVCLSVLSVTLVYCGQTVGWIKMKLGMQVGLGTGHIVSDGDPARPCPHCVRCSPSSPCLKGAQSLNFLTMSVMGKWLDRSRWQLVEK